MRNATLRMTSTTAFYRGCCGGVFFFLLSLRSVASVYIYMSPGKLREGKYCKNDRHNNRGGIGSVQCRACFYIVVS
uniref:Putative secreted protein n=1 Tax=Ixodes ricinus TaxID=34613 RepID=A0A6B0TVX1_IXORI